jgi:hypothetical protein
MVTHRTAKVTFIPYKVFFGFHGGYHAAECVRAGGCPVGAGLRLNRERRYG